MATVEVRGQSYSINDKLKEKLDNIKDGKLKKIDEDRVYIIDGRERIGKSTLAFQLAAYIDPTILDDMSRVTFSAEETLNAIRNTQSTNKETKVIIYDEAFRGLSSKSALSKTNKKIVQALMEMGQNNLVLFLVSPSFFLLELYSSVLRSNTLFHVVKNKKGRRYFRIFNHKKKAILYQYGIRKGWGYKLYTKHKSYFSSKFPGGKEAYKRYNEKKQKSLREMDVDEKKKKDDKYMIERDDIIYLVLKNKFCNQRELSDLSKGGTFPLSKPLVGHIYRKMLEKHEKMTKTKD